MPSSAHVKLAGWLAPQICALRYFIDKLLKRVRHAYTGAFMIDGRASYYARAVGATPSPRSAPSVSDEPSRRLSRRSSEREMSGCGSLACEIASAPVRCARGLLLVQITTVLLTQVKVKNQGHSLHSGRLPREVSTTHATQHAGARARLLSSLPSTLQSACALLC